MTLVIGVDEAGYGPNLGPLVIGLSAWEVARGPLSSSSEPVSSGEPAVDLFGLLDRVVSAGPCDGRLAVADSKALYKPGGGLETLERGVLAMLELMDVMPAVCWDSLVEVLAADCEGSRHGLPWHADGYNADVPRDTCRDALAKTVTRLRSELPEEVALRAMRARLVYPAEFNAACQRHGSKGMALSCWTLELVRGVLDELVNAPVPSPHVPAPVYITCDKHGGRNSYAGLLVEHFPEWTLRVVTESRPRSAYLLERDGRQIRIEFRSKGESQLEAALASMVAKYLRELAMHAFNAYWQSHLSGLKPTAGYPMDAKRFKADIAAKQRELGIDDAVLWRER